MSKRVFIVEDDQTLVEAYREILALKGFEVVGWAVTGEEAIGKVPSLVPPPDVIIMDHRLPEKSGVEVMVEIRKQLDGVPFLFVSADPSAKPLAYEHGAAGFLLKPFELKELITLLGRLSAGTDGG